MFKEYSEQIRQRFEYVRANYINLAVSIADEIRNPIDLLLREQNICLTGLAGSGKTTILRYLATCLAESIDHYLPIFVPMRQVPENIQMISARSLIEFCPDPLAPSKLLDRPSGDSPLFIFLDSLDKMEISKQKHFLKALTQWNEELPEAVWILSTRPHFIELVPEWYTIAELLPIDSSQMQEFATKLQSGKSLLSTYEKLNERGAPREFARNPLFLELISMVSDQVTTLPSSWTELFSSCVDVLLRRWDKKRGIPLQSPAAIRRALSKITLHMIATNSQSVDISNFLTNDFLNLNYDVELIDQEQDLLRSAFLVRTGSSHYHFTHKSFEEYFAALAIASLPPKTAVNILRITNSETLLEFLANLSEQLDDFLSEKINKNQVNLDLKFIYFVPIEQTSIRFNFLNRITEKLGASGNFLPLDTGVFEHKNGFAKNWNQCKKIINPQQKRKCLEDFVETVFLHVFFVINKDRLTKFREIDLICEQREFSPFWGRWQSDIFVECKNHEDKSPVSDINEFVGKASAAGAQLRVFVSMTGFTSYAMTSMRSTWERSGVPDIVWVTGDDFDCWVESTEDVEPFLKKICCRALLDR